MVTPFPFSCYVNTLRTGICGNCKGVDSCSQGLVFFPCSLLEEDSEEEGDMCRICQIAGGSPTNPLLEPCGCVGSLQFVHQECLKKWLKVKITSGRRGRKSSQLMTNIIGGASGRGSAWTAPPSPPGACSGPSFAARQLQPQPTDMTDEGSGLSAVLKSWEGNETLFKSERRILDHALLNSTPA